MRHTDLQSVELFSNLKDGELSAVLDDGNGEALWRVHGNANVVCRTPRELRAVLVDVAEG